MKIITFSSSSGGVGQTTLLANTAIELANRGFKVLIWDLDCFKSDVHYLFGKTDEDMKTGTLELFEEYTGLMKSGAEISVEEVIVFEKENFINLQKNIDLIPFANLTNRFISRNNDFNWFEFYEVLDGGGYLEYIKTDTFPKLGYDYILIDTATNFNYWLLPIPVLQFADIIVFLINLNTQNIERLSNLFDKIEKCECKKERLFLPLISHQNQSLLNPLYNQFLKTFNQYYPKTDEHIPISYSDKRHRLISKLLISLK